MRKKLCILQVTPECPNPAHVEMFQNKDNIDFYFVTHDAEHKEALQFCPNTTWTDTRNILAEKVPKNYDYYAFVDYDYQFESLSGLSPADQMLEDLNEFNPAVLTYYPGKGMITPFASNLQYRNSRNHSIIPFTHCGMKVVHHSLLNWFFPMITSFGGGVEACHLFNILETPFLSNVVCSHKMIYHNGNTDTEAPHNQDGAYNKYCMDQMWQWIAPAFKKMGLLNFYATSPQVLNDSMLIKEAFQKIFLTKQVQPAKSAADVNYYDEKRFADFFDLTHDRFLNTAKSVEIQMSDVNKKSMQIIEKHLHKITYSQLNKRKNPWHKITNDINSKLNKVPNAKKITALQCAEIYQNIDNPKSLFIDNSKFDDAFAELLSGKRVAYVGPSPYLMGSGNGLKIDDYDVVVRIQGAIFEQEDYGSKVDVIQSCLNANYGPALARHLHQIDKSMYPKFIMCNDTNARPLSDGTWGDVLNEYDSYLRDFGIPLAHLKNDDGTWDRWGLYWEVYPKSHVERFGTGQYTVNSENFNSGYGAINMLLRYPIKELYITGIDFYNMGTPQTAEQKYNPRYVEKFGKEGTPYGPDKTLHDQLSQIKHFKNVILKNRNNVILDNYLSEKLTSDALEKRIEKFMKLPKFKNETN